MKYRRPPKSEHAVWALLFMSPESQRTVREFFISKLGLSEEFVESSLHLTVYHSRRKLPGLEPYSKQVRIDVEPEYWRFMVLVPGGENPHPDIDVARNRIGVRIQRRARAYEQVLDLRSRFYPLEAPVVAGGGVTSGARRNAFGIRDYQPHVALLRAGSGIDPDLTKAGVVLRSSLPVIRFDRLVVRCLTAGQPGPALGNLSKLSNRRIPIRKPRTSAPPGIASLDALPNPLRAAMPNRRHYRKGKAKGALITIQLPDLVQRPKIAPDAALRLIPKLPGMAPQEIARLFANSVSNLADPAKAYLHEATRKLVDAISEEWRRREQASDKPDDYFQWPSTDADGGDGTLSGGNWPSEGLLKYMGYTVGSTQGERAEVRKLILAQVFSGHLPQIVSPSARLRKMAETLAAFARNAKRRVDASLDQAVRDWERDLSFLYQEYYVGHFSFWWPSTAS